MNTIYSAFGAVVFVALLVSAYKFLRCRNNFARVIFWLCAVVLAALVYVDEKLAITQPALQPIPTALTTDEVQSLVATFRETETELKKFHEVDAVYFAADHDTCAIEIKLVVNDLADEKFFREINDETIRTFLHAAVDNWDNPSALTGGGEYVKGIIGRLKISVIVIRQQQKAPRAEGLFLLANRQPIHSE